MIWTAAGILVAIEIYACFRYRDIVCPAVLHNVFWILALIGANAWNLESEMDSWAMVIIVIGSIIFQIGFAFSRKATLKSKYNHGEACQASYEYIVNHQMVKLLVVVVVIASLPSLYQYYIYMRSSGGTLYNMLSTADENISLPSYFSHFRKIVANLSLAFLTLYWKTDKAKRKDMRKYVMALFIIAALFVASVPTRNGVLFYVLPLLILFMCTHKLSNKMMILLGVGAIAGFMGIYYGISLGKYWYLYDSSSARMEVLADELKTYLSGSIVAFAHTFREHAYMYNGKNTFRFFMAVGDAVFGTSSALKLTNTFVSISDLRTNVFTFYDFYLRDFGVAYALFAQFIVSCIHGASYKGMNRGSLLQIYMFSMLSYPLIMQFFQDQYCSLLSTWIQIGFVGVVILKTNIFVRRIPVCE